MGHRAFRKRWLALQNGKSSRDENPFAQIPFPGAPFGFYNGRPRFLPFAGAWYKLLDWLT